MSGSVKQFVDYTNNTNNDTGENNAASIQPISDGENVNAAVSNRGGESLRQRTEALRNVLADSLYLRDADRGWIVTGPHPLITWPGSTTGGDNGIPVISNALWILPMLTPGAGANAPPVASAFGLLHLKRSSDSANAVSVTSRRRSYAAGDQINVTVSSGASFSCVLDAENGLQRTIKIVATASTTLGTVISALNALTPSAPDNTQLVTAALEGGALSSDFLLAPQARQYVSGNYDGEAHQIGVSTLSGFFASNPTQALAEGDTLCVRYDMVTDLASTGGRRQALLENSNVNLPSSSLFNSRVHPELLPNAIPVCKVVSSDLVFPGGRTIQRGAVNVSLAGNTGADFSYSGGGAWADGTTNPATTVEAQLDKIISDLSGATGTAKIQGVAVGTDLAVGTLKSQIDALVANWMLMTRDNSITGSQTFQKTINAVNGITSGGFPATFANFTFTVPATTGVFTASAHPILTGTGPFQLTTTGTLPGGLSTGTNYWGILVDSSHFSVASSFANAMAGIAIVNSSLGSGTQTVSRQPGTLQTSTSLVTGVQQVNGSSVVNGNESVSGNQTIGGNLSVVGSISSGVVNTINVFASEWICDNPSLVVLTTLSAGHIQITGGTSLVNVFAPIRVPEGKTLVDLILTYNPENVATFTPHINSCNRLSGLITNYATQTVDKTSTSVESASLLVSPQLMSVNEAFFVQITLSPLGPSLYNLAMKFKD